MNITFLDRKTLGEVPNLDQLNQLGSVTLHDTTRPEQVVERLQKQQVAITNKVVLTQTTLEQLPDLRLICVAATGTNNVDTAYARERGVAVKNVQGYSTPSVVQVTWTLILTLLQRPQHFNEFVYSGAYARHDIFTYFDPPFGEVAGQRLGIIGLGTIGKQVAEVGTAFGAEVAYVSSRPDASQDPSKPAEYVCLPRMSCWHVGHCLDPRSAERGHRDMIAYPQLKCMPNCLIDQHGARGHCQRSRSARAIDEGLIGGAGVDVFTQEPLPAGHPYLGVKNKNRLLLTPHLAWAAEARARLLDGVCENIREFQAS